MQWKHWLVPMGQYKELIIAVKSQFVLRQEIATTGQFPAARQPRRPVEHCGSLGHFHDILQTMKPSTIRPYLVSGLVLSLITLAAFHRRIEKPVSTNGVLAGDSEVEVTKLTINASTQTATGKSTYPEVKEFRESENLDILPSTKFKIESDVKAKQIPNSDELVVWTSIDFVVAPASQANERLEISQLATSASWGQITEMKDVQAVVLDRFLSLEPTHIVFSESDLGPVLAAFPLGNAGNLWPWLMRVNVHVQDRDGKPVADAECIVRLWPSRARLGRSD